MKIDLQKQTDHLNISKYILYVGIGDLFSHSPLWRDDSRRRRRAELGGDGWRCVECGVVPLEPSKKMNVHCCWLYAANF